MGAVCSTPPVLLNTDAPLRLHRSERVLELHGLTTAAPRLVKFHPRFPDVQSLAVSFDDDSVVVVDLGKAPVGAVGDAKLLNSLSKTARFTSVR